VSDVAAARDKRQLTRLRDELLDLQVRLRHEPAFALAFIIAGAPAAGRSEVLHELLEWLDPKYVNVHAFPARDRAARSQPVLERYWRTLPPRGRIAFYFTGWYEDCLGAATTDAGKKKKKGSARRAAERIRRLEAMLTADRVRIVKAYLRIDAKTQRERLARLRADKLTRWRVTREDLRLAKKHQLVARAAAQCIESTDQSAARWHVIDGADERKRLLSVARLLRDALRVEFAGRARSASRPQRLPRPSTPAPAMPTEPAKRVGDEVYGVELAKLQGRVARLVRRGRFGKRSLVLAFEGMDAAGKGGAIRRIAQALDVRQYRVVPIGAPTSEEALHPYLWRFWRCIPERGAITIYDRSWYGRVLVERVRGFAQDADWMRAYDEIREFELELAEAGVIVAKFWLNVGKDEQLQRFTARDADPLKRFKVDKEDWKNRDYYDAYQRAAIEMIRRTDATHAPWQVVPADHKDSARLLVLDAVCDQIERALDEK
jgi:polyphosphate:AMP phosphotransferase